MVWVKTYMVHKIRVGPKTFGVGPKFYVVLTIGIEPKAHAWISNFCCGSEAFCESKSTYKNLNLCLILKIKFMLLKILDYPRIDLAVPMF